MMLLGENATGKSSILQSIALAMMTATQRKTELVYDDFIARDNGEWTVDHIQPAEISLTFNDGTSSMFRIDENFNAIGEGVSNIVFWHMGQDAL